MYDTPCGSGGLNLSFVHGELHALQGELSPAHEGSDFLDFYGSRI